jgi:selenocysteine-specific elongation factor
VRVLPADRVVRVRGIQTHGAQVAAAEPGHRTAIALAGIEVAEVGRGSFLVADSTWRPSTVLRADVVLLDDAPRPLRPRTAVRFHIGTADVGARVVVPNGSLSPGERRSARIMLDEPVVLRAGDRFVLRSASPAATIGGGIVVDPYASRRARPWSAASDSPAEERLALALDEAGATGLELASLPVRLGAAPSQLAPLIADSDALQLGGRLYAAGVVESLRDRLVGLVDEGHRARPLEPGLSLQEVRSRLAAAPELVDHVLWRAVEDGLLDMAAGIVRRAGWEPRLTGAQRAALDQIAELVYAAGSEPPSLGELESRFGRDTPDLVRLLEREGRIVAVEPERFYDARCLTSLVDKLEHGMTERREYSPAELRDVLGVSRKFLIPLLEYCDRRGYTARGANGRVWRGAS